MASNTLELTGRKDWRAWLATHGTTEREIWLVYFKKHTGKPTISYDDAVEEALCFGWIDSIVKRIDDERYMQKYTPRRKNSVWSALNKRRALKMIRQGRMTCAGMDRIKEAKQNGRWRSAVPNPVVPTVPPDLKHALAANKKAQKNFENLASSHKKQYIGWIASAKKEETRKRRIAETIKLVAGNKKPRMM